MKHAKFALLIFIALAVNACAPNRGSTPDVTPGPGTTADESKAVADPVNDADILADDGEAILGIRTLTESQEKFRASLAADPKNARADIWNAYINLLVEMKGFVSRIRPVFESQADGAQRYKRIVADIMNVREPYVRQYFLQGAGDMRSTNEIQDWMDRYSMRLDDLRTAISRHKSSEVRLLIPREFLGQMINFIDPIGESQCQHKAYGPIDDNTQKCDSDHIPVLFNRADFDVFEAQVASYETLFSLLNAYVIDPKAVAKIQDAAFSDSSSFVELINASSKLRKTNLLPLAGLSVRDYAIAMKYEMEHAQDLCPKGRSAYRSRPGHFFSLGLCIGDAPPEMSARFTRIIDQVLNHQPLTIFTDKQDSIVDIDFDRIISQPIPDLSVIGPIKAPYGQEPTFNMTPLVPYAPRGSITELVKSFGSGR